MRVRVREEVHIRASTAEVYAWLLDFARSHEWLGASFREARAEGDALAFRLALPLHAPPTRLVFGEREPPVYLELVAAGDHASVPALDGLTWALHADGRVAHVTVEAAYTPAPGLVGALFEPVVHRPLRRQALRDALWRLKHVAEGTAPVPPRVPVEPPPVAEAPRAIEAVIFDLDGVLVDTEPLHLAATRALVAPATLELAEYERFIGRGGFKEWLELTYGLSRSHIDEHYSPLFFAELERGLAPLDGAIALVAALQARGVPLAVASQSSRPWVEATLRAAGLLEYFPVIVTAEEAGRDKPAPDVYVHAAAALGIEPSRCLAIEDSAHGIRSAVDAGLVVVQSRQAAFPQEAQPGSAAVIESLRDFDLDWLETPPRG